MGSAISIGAEDDSDSITGKGMIADELVFRNDPDQDHSEMMNWFPSSNQVGSALPASRLASFPPPSPPVNHHSGTVQLGETEIQIEESASENPMKSASSASQVVDLRSSALAVSFRDRTVPTPPVSHQIKKLATWAIKPCKDSYVDRRLPSDVSIFKVPKFLKESKKEIAYVPNIVSLGPYHYKSAKLKPMNIHKHRALHRMMRRFNNNHRKGQDNPEDFVVLAIQKISQDDKIRKSYDQWPTSEDFDVCITLDGCFILEILRTLGNDVWFTSEYYEPIFESRKIDLTGFDILNDILKLENQIPLTVLRYLLELELNSVDNANKFLFDVLVKTPGTKFYPFDYEKDMKGWSWPPPDEQVHHFLGLLHSLVVSPPAIENQLHQIDINCINCIPSTASLQLHQLHEGEVQIDINCIKCIPSAVELSNKAGIKCIPSAVELSNKAGIKFQRCSGGIKKIKFHKSSATVDLPPINITDHTEVLFRNLIALELCNPSKINYVTCYLNLMNKLIDTEKDVAVLKESKIIANYLGSDAEVAELFNGLCMRVTLTKEDAFEQLEQQVIELYGSKFKVWLAELAKDYLSSPWKILALVGAILALVLTFVQTIYSVQ